MNDHLFPGITDIHTHIPSPGAICSIDLFTQSDKLPENGVMSVGFHPWHSQQPPTEEMWTRFEELARDERVVAIGECGIDMMRGGELFRQIEIFAHQAEVAERVGKPLIIHNVKAQQQLIGMKKEMKPTVPWIIHGFRGKPTVARMFLDAGFYLSFGDKYNPQSYEMTPPERRLTETDRTEE